MNQLRQLMLEELERRNFAATTIRTYLHGVAHFSRYFRRPPDRLGPEDIRKYQAMLFSKLKYSPNTVILRLASLRFFYIHVLKRNWSIAETPYPKKLRHLPGILSQEEVARLIQAADTPFHRILLMTMYATGARRAEAARLKSERHLPVETPSMPASPSGLGKPTCCPILPFSHRMQPNSVCP